MNASATIAVAVARLRPGASFSVPDIAAPAAADITWHDESVPVSQAELEAALRQIMVQDAMNEARETRTLLFGRLDGLQASANATGNAALALEIEGVKTALRNMTAVVSLDGLTTRDAMRKAFTARLNEIASPLSGPLKLAFATLDA